MPVETLPQDVKDKIIIVSGSAHEPLARATAESMGMPLGEVERRKHLDTERYVRIEESVLGKHAFIIQPHVAGKGMSVDDAFFEHIMLI
ncbi:MAG: Phosphoribosylpyrophosphate synthetase, partial [Candidatus Saccharibacteria bacterium]|nr:Phosphoribosylpyrophosphate synthetase [Candidatus Saccharibacteria bacterium]